MFCFLVFLVPPKKKIAGVSNVAMLLKPPTTNTSNKPSSTGTSPSRFYNKTTQRVDEYGRLVKVRVAHAPNMVSSFSFHDVLQLVFQSPKHS